MRKTLRETQGIDRAYIEAHIAAVVAIGVEYGFCLKVDRFTSCALVELKEYYKDSPRMIDGVEIAFDYNSAWVEINRRVLERSSKKYIRSDSARYPDFSSEALEHIMRLVWDIETE